MRDETISAFVHRKNNCFSKILKNLARYILENNFLVLSK